LVRIVSLLPSATEIVYALNLQDDLHGVTYACDFPSAAADKPVIVTSRIQDVTASGEIDQRVKDSIISDDGIYLLHLETLEEARPDLVLTQALCEVCAVPSQQVHQALDNLPHKPEVLSLDPHSLGDVVADVEAVGKAAGVEDRATKLAASLRERRDRVASLAATADTQPRVVCLEWLDPLMVGGHWVPEMVALAGGVDCFGKPGQPSFTVEWEQVIEAQPDVIIAMPCGFDVRRGLSEIKLLTEKPGWKELPAAKSDSLFVVDANSYFSRSGPRLVDGLEVMAEILLPELFNGLVPIGGAFRVFGKPF
jgi:iron complex transport system substrate-binding protein